jgi:hypothetical protein
MIWKNPISEIPYINLSDIARDNESKYEHICRSGQATLIFVSPTTEFAYCRLMAPSYTFVYISFYNYLQEHKATIKNMGKGFF